MILPIYQLIFVSHWFRFCSFLWLLVSCYRLHIVQTANICINTVTHYLLSHIVFLLY